MQGFGSLPLVATVSNTGVEVLFDAIPEALVATDLTGLIVQMNRAAGRLFGCVPDEYVGVPMETLLAEESRGAYRSHRQAFLRQEPGSNSELECLGLTADGSEMPIDATVGMTELGGAPCILMGIREVSDRVATQRRLERRVEIETLAVRLSGRLNTSPNDDIDVAVEESLGEMSRFVGAQRAYVFHISPDESSMRVSHEWCADPANDHRDRLQDVATDSLPWMMRRIRQRRVVSISSPSSLPEGAEAERRYLRHHGVGSMVAVPMMAVRGVAGCVVFESLDGEPMQRRPDEISALMMFQDHLLNAMRRKRAAEEIRRANRILQAVSECNDALIRAEDEDQLLRDVCRIVVEAGGYRVAWVGVGLNDLDRSIRPMATWGDDAHIRSLRLSWAAEGFGGTGPAAVTIRDARPVIVDDIETGAGFPDTGRASALANGYRSVIAVPFAYSEEMRGVLIVYATEAAAFDVPEVATLQRFANDLAFGIQALRTREREREARQELRAMLDSKDQFIATIAHELRTPLTGVVGFAQLLRDGHTRMGSDERGEMVRLVIEQGLDLTNIVDDLLVIAKAEAGSLNVAKVPVDLRAQATQILESCGLDRLERVQVEGPAAPAVGDPARVRQIVRNLITNSHRYGGANIRVEVSCDDENSHVSVVDDGPGVPEDDKETIFEPYRRAHDAPGLTASMGLGLTISRQLARLMGGDLTYLRRDEETVFTLTLPRP